jgi:hypothetical protein
MRVANVDGSNWSISNVEAVQKVTLKIAMQLSEKRPLRTAQDLRSSVKEGVRYFRKRRGKGCSDLFAQLR